MQVKRINKIVLSLSIPLIAVSVGITGWVSHNIVQKYYETEYSNLRNDVILLSKKTISEKIRKNANSFLSKNNAKIYTKENWNSLSILKEELIQEFKKEEKNINDAIKKIKSPITKNTLKNRLKNAKTFQERQAILAEASKALKN
ncbi:hypothetical protein [Mycoplasmopsis cynos]|uniref:hypothetical protein n=1 Tax=Mycoplasmopsis cynos TaxID=171284 RepID=UPI002B003BDC|nr:hypothetical protein [Mycoplasmopsis cynos]WQQ14701.1 hypothetical protein RRG42_03800 [Mycoplasmopsis cynos]